MALFTILGKPNCASFAHALVVAEYLQKNLPNFKFKALAKLDEDLREELEWDNWENDWYLTENDTPIIWKEISSVPIKKYLIGGLSDFWEYCYDYYGLELLMSKDSLEGLAKENFEIYRKTYGKITNYKHVISIVGEDSLQLEFIIQHLPEALNLEPEDINIRIFVDFFDLLPDLSSNIFTTESYEELLTNCDYLIILQDYSQNSKETLKKWLNRISFSIKLIADKINVYAKRELKVIFCNPGCTCLNATILMGFCTAIRLSNIVAITADVGLEVLHKFSEITGTHPKKMGAPPVWGWPGMADFVDMDNIVVKAEIITPFQRSTKPNFCTLPLGKISYELRLSKYLNNKQVEEEIALRRDSTAKSLKRSPILGKVRSLISLIKLWGTNDHNSIISLGVCSNGSFGLPTGVIMSQPVTLNNQKIWQPFTQYPVGNRVKNEIKTIIDSAKKALCLAQVPNHLCNCQICAGL